jgi:ABC-type glycerol-3-phosphate transport system substrate-binding protein
MAKWDWGVPTLKAAADGPVMKDTKTKPYKNVDLLRKSMDIEANPWPRNPASESFMIPWRRLGAMNTGQMAPKEFLEKEAEGFLTQILKDTDWNKSKDKPGFRLEGIIEKSQAEK